jgi:hypothetical protein
MSRLDNLGRQWATPNEAAKFTNQAPRTIYYQAKRNQIPHHYTHGRRGLRFDIAELRQYIDLKERGQQDDRSALQEESRALQEKFHAVWQEHCELKTKYVEAIRQVDVLERIVEELWRKTSRQSDTAIADGKVDGALNLMGL